MSEAVWSAAALVLPTNSASKSPSPSPAMSDISRFASVIKGLSDRSYEKRKTAALDVEHLVKQDPSPANVNSIIAMLNSDFIASTQSNCRKGGLIALAAVAIGLGQSCNQYLDSLLPPVLLLMQDQESRCRYYACESLYNITKIGRSHVLKHFNAIYDGLCTLHADPDPDVRNAASLLDRLMKDVVTESDQFNIANFMPLLQERILIKDSAIRELNVGWIQVLDSVPDIDLLRFLPGILSGLFNMLADPNPSIVTAADECLSEFLNEITSTQPDTIEDMIPVLVQQSSGSCPAVCKLMALKWLESFVVLFKGRLLPRYPVLINGLLTCMSETDHDNIRSQAESISKSMMHQVGSSNEPLSALEGLLHQLTDNLNLNRACTKLPILDWIQMVLEKHPDELFKAIDQLFPALIQTLSDPSDHVVQVDLTLLAEISRNPAYFDSFFSHLLRALCVDSLLLKSRSSLIVRELCALLTPRVVFCAISRLFPSSQDYQLESLSTVIQILSDLLLTSPSLYEFRREVQNCLQSKDGVDLLKTLLQAWVYNPVATLSLCLLSQAYDLANAVVCCFADSQVTVGFLIEIDRLIMLIESPVFIRLRLQLLDPQSFPSLIRALHGILMVLPSQGASFKSLSTRLQTVSSVGMLQVSPRSKINPLAVESVMEPKMVSECLEHFRNVQSLFTQSRLKGLKEKRIVTALADLPLQ